MSAPDTNSLSLEKFLLEYAKTHDLNPLDPESYWARPIIGYSEDVNPDADNGEAWLENRTSYIWKVGTLAILDDNKRDFAYVYIGIQRTSKHAPEFFGFYHLPDGENTDAGRVIKRIVKCLQDSDCIFEDN